MLPVLGTRFAITDRSATLLVELMSLTEEIISVSLIRLLSVVNDASFGSGDVFPCWSDEALAEDNHEVSTEKK